MKASKFETIFLRPPNRQRRLFGYLINQYVVCLPFYLQIKCNLVPGKKRLAGEFDKQIEQPCLPAFISCLFAALFTGSAFTGLQLLARAGLVDRYPLISNDLESILMMCQKFRAQTNQFICRKSSIVELGLRNVAVRIFTILLAEIDGKSRLFD